MSDHDGERPSPDAEATARLLKEQLAHLRRWYARERWKIDPQVRSFAPTPDGRDKTLPPADPPAEPQIKPRGRIAAPPKGRAGPES